VPFTSFSLFLGLATAVTPFPVLARILTDRRLDRTELGLVALSCAAADDVTAWCLLALVVGVAMTEVGVPVHPVLPVRPSRPSRDVAQESLQGPQALHAVGEPGAGGPGALWAPLLSLVLAVLAVVATRTPGVWKTLSWIGLFLAVAAHVALFLLRDTPIPV
jgi:hypothetical protein